MKRVFSVLLAVVLIVAAIGIPAFAADEPAFTVASATAKPGEQVELAVSIKNNPGIASFELDVQYDKTALEWVEVKAENIGGTWDTEKPDNVYWGGSENLTVNGKLFTIVLKVKDGASGNQTVTLTYDPDNVYDISEANVAFSVEAGTVTVEGGEEPPVPGDKPVFEVASATAKPGEQVELAVSIKNNPGIASFELDVQYDKAALEWVEAKAENIGGTWDTEKPDNVYWGGSEDLMTDGKLFTIVLKVKDGASGDVVVTLSYDPDNVYNIAEKNIEFEITAGTVTVEGGELPPAPTPEHHEAKDASCTEAGNIEYWTLEGKFYSDAECTTEITEADTVIPAKGHTLVKTEEVPADCTNAGTEAYYTCSVCNKMFSDAEGTTEITAPVEIPAKGHTPGTPVRENEVPATTEAAGSYDEVVYCTVCGAEISRETKTIPQLHHVHTMEKVEAKAATCTEDGNIEYYKCTACGKLFSDAAGTAEITLESTVIPAAHTPGEAVKENEVPADCTTAGSYDEVVYCTVCGAEISRETKTIEALGHDWGEWVDNGDETKTRTCSRCGETETVPTGLSKVEAKPATCTEAGSIEYYVDTETGKLYADIEGATEITEADTVIPALGHDWGVWQEQFDGSMVRTCSRCGEIETLTAGPVEPPVTPVTPVIPSRPTTYKLSFETNGGSAIEAVTGNANQEVFLASYVPTCEGKTFYGWFTEAELTNKVDKVTLSKDTTVYAFWLPFSDIPADAWYIDEVAQLKPLGLLDGFDTAEFKGDEQTTRGMIVTTLYALAGAPEVTGEMAFNDVAEDNFSYKAVIWATENGIAKGYGDGTFKPDQSVSRQELVCFLYRYAAFKGIDVTGRADLSAYTDAAQVASWAAEEMAWAVNTGLVKGMSDTVLQPAGTGTHAQWAALLVRVAELGK